MNYNVITLPFFDKQIKRLVKKYPSLKKEFTTLVAQLISQPATGTPLGDNCYKIRLGIASKNSGKSGGARIITYVQVVNTSVYLVSIYDKSEQGNLSDKDVKELIKYIPQ
jgi:mRNA-degrading endonuclease RelE of RelBE toxin-antitoxin system